MTTPLAHEPMPGDGLVPYMSVLVDRLYHRIPEVYRTMDGADTTWAFKRYLGGLLDYAGLIDATILGMTGDRPVGPAVLEPWALPADELAYWREARANRPSSLGDPMQAEVAWLPWMAQLVGARLDPAATEAEKRDTIRYATSGWRGGTRAAIEDAARSALTGTRYARVVPHTKPGMSGGLEPATIWDITIVTRTAETPDPAEVLNAVLRKGVKPAGAVLWHTPYQATWDQIEAILPTWADWEAVGGWTAIEEVGLVYRALTDNLMPNPSFEVDTTGWTARGAISTIGRVLGGVDGVGMCQVTTTAAGTGEIDAPVVTVVAGNNYIAGFSLRADETRYAQFFVDFYTAADAFVSSHGVAIGTATADVWVRGFTLVAAPATATKAKLYVQVTGMALGEHYDLDAFIVRSV